MRLMKHFVKEERFIQCRDLETKKKILVPHNIRTDNVQIPLECSNHCETRWGLSPIRFICAYFLFLFLSFFFLLFTLF